MKNKLIISISVVAILAVIGFQLFRNKQKLNESSKVVDRSAIAVPVTIEQAKVAPISGAFSVPAVVQPITTAGLSINTSGKLQTLNIQLGTVVRKGQVLGSVDNSLKYINLESAQLLAAKSEADYLRVKDLYEGKASTEVDFNNAKYNYENAKTQVRQIQQQITDGQIIAPISGMVTKKNVEAGEFVNMGTSIGTIVDVSRLKSFVAVSEKNVYALKTGAPVTIRTDIYPDQKFKGTIRYISPNGDESHNYDVEIAIQNDSKLYLKGGTFIMVHFDIPNKGTALQIPKIALVEGLKNPYVYVVNKQKATVKKLVLGRDLGEHIEVLSGLDAGEQVITSGQINISTNSIIEIVNTK